MLVSRSNQSNCFPSGPEAEILALLSPKSLFGGERNFRPRNICHFISSSSLLLLIAFMNALRYCLGREFFFWGGVSLNLLHAAGNLFANVI